jgi:hypothetical protein
VAFTDDGTVMLFRFDGAWRTLAEVEDPLRAFSSRAPHRRKATPRDHRRSVLSATSRAGAFPGGRYGIGTFDGRAVFRDVEGVSL